MNNDKPNAFLYINTKISYLARKPWWSAWGSEQIKKMQDNCTVEQWQWGTLPGTNILQSFEFQWFRLRESFVYGNPDKLISLLSRIRSEICLSFKYLGVQILGSITCYYSLKGDILTGSGTGWGSFIENIWNISAKISSRSPLLSCVRPFYFDLINHVFIYLTRVNSTRRKIWK